MLKFSKLRLMDISVLMYEFSFVDNNNNNLFVLTIHSARLPRSVQSVMVCKQ